MMVWEDLENKRKIKQKQRSRRSIEQCHHFIFNLSHCLSMANLLSYIRETEGRDRISGSFFPVGNTLSTFLE